MRKIRLPKEPEYHGPNPRGFYLYQCPYCEDAGWPADINYHFGWNPVTGRYNCVRCGAGGPAPVLKHPFGKPAPDALAFAGLDAGQNAAPEPVARTISGYHPLGDTSVQSRALTTYLKGRGLSTAEMRRRRLGYSTEPFFAFAIMIPFFSREAKVELYQARFTRHRPVRGGKYWTAPVAEGWPPRSTVLYGLRWLEDDGPPILVEGVFDAMTVRNGLAYLGSSVSRAQAVLVAKLSAVAVLAPDGGLTSASVCVQRSIHNLAEAGARPLVCELPDGADPASLGGERMAALVRSTLRKGT